MSFANHSAARLADVIVVDGSPSPARPDRVAGRTLQPHQPDDDVIVLDNSPPLVRHVSRPAEPILVDDGPRKRRRRDTPSPTVRASSSQDTSPVIVVDDDDNVDDDIGIVQAHDQDSDSILPVARMASPSAPQTLRYFEREPSTSSIAPQVPEPPRMSRDTDDVIEMAAAGPRLEASSGELPSPVMPIEGFFVPQRQRLPGSPIRRTSRRNAVSMPSLVDIRQPAASSAAQPIANPSSGLRRRRYGLPSGAVRPVSPSVPPLHRTAVVPHLAVPVHPALGPVPTLNTGATAGPSAHAAANSRSTARHDRAGVGAIPPPSAISPQGLDAFFDSDDHPSIRLDAHVSFLDEVRFIDAGPSQEHEQLHRHRMHLPGQHANVHHSSGHSPRSAFRHIVHRRLGQRSQPSQNPHMGSTPDISYAGTISTTNMLGHVTNAEHLDRIERAHMLAGVGILHNVDPSTRRGTLRSARTMHASGSAAGPSLTPRVPGHATRAAGSSRRRAGHESSTATSGHRRRHIRSPRYVTVFGSVGQGLHLEVLQGALGDRALDYEQLIRLDEQLVREKNRADEEQIESLPVATATAADKEIRCCVCMCDVEEGEELRVLPCSHKYHRRCIDEWLTYNGCCPVDKKRIAPPRSRRRCPAHRNDRSRSNYV